MVNKTSGFSCSIRDTPASKSEKDLDLIKYLKDVGMAGPNKCAVKVC